MSSSDSFQNLWHFKHPAFSFRPTFATLPKFIQFYHYNAVENPDAHRRWAGNRRGEGRHDKAREGENRGEGGHSAGAAAPDTRRQAAEGRQECR